MIGPIIRSRVIGYVNQNNLIQLKGKNKMETYNTLTTEEQQLVYCALELLRDDYDFAWSMLQDKGIYLDNAELEEIAEHFHLID